MYRLGAGVKSNDENDGRAPMDKRNIAVGGCRNHALLFRCSVTRVTNTRTDGLAADIRDGKNTFRSHFWHRSEMENCSRIEHPLLCCCVRFEEGRI